MKGPKNEDPSASAQDEMEVIFRFNVNLKVEMILTAVAAVTIAAMFPLPSGSPRDTMTVGRSEDAATAEGIVPIGVTPSLLPVQDQASLERQAKRLVLAVEKDVPSFGLRETAGAGSSAFCDISKPDLHDDLAFQFVGYDQLNLVLGRQHVPTYRRPRVTYARLDLHGDVLSGSATYIDQDQVRNALGIGPVEHRDAGPTAPEVLYLSDQSGNSVQGGDETEDNGNELKDVGHGKPFFEIERTRVHEKQRSTNILAFAILALVPAWGLLFHIVVRTGSFERTTRGVLFVLWAAATLGMVAIVACTIPLLKD